MRLGGIEVKVLKNKEQLKNSCLSAACLINFSQLVESDWKKLRKSLFSCFQKAQKDKVSSLVFLCEDLPDTLDYRFFSKIAAQEVFRFFKEKNNGKIRRISFLAGSSQAYKVMNKNIISYLGHLKENKGPFLTVDGIVQYKEGIVLIKRTNPPLGWALPGGFVDYRESLEKAVAREVKEETGLEFIEIKQFKVYSENNRDPRFHTVSVVFSGKGRGRLNAGSDAQDAAVFKVKEDSLKNLPTAIAFDHHKIISQWLSD